MPRGSIKRLRYQLYKFDKFLKKFKKDERFTTINDICTNIDVTAPTCRKIISGRSKKYCKIYKIEKI